MQIRVLGQRVRRGQGQDPAVISRLIHSEEGREIQCLDTLKIPGQERGESRKGVHSSSASSPVQELNPFLLPLLADGGAISPSSHSMEPINDDQRGQDCPYRALNSLGQFFWAILGG